MSRVDEGRDTAEVPARGSDFLQLAVADVPAGGKAEWLTGRLREAMADGRLAVGSRLPPTRVLAAELRVSRGVVTEAYRRLAEDGQVAGRRRGGTVVLATPFASAPPTSSGGGGDSPGAGEEGVHGGIGAAGGAADAGDLAGLSSCERGCGAGEACAGRRGGEPEGACTGPDAEPYARGHGDGPDAACARPTGTDSHPGSGQSHGPNGSRPDRPHSGRRGGEPEGACTGRDAEPYAHGRGGEPDGACTGRDGGTVDGACAGRGGRADGPWVRQDGGAGSGGVPGAEVFDVLRAAPADVDFTPGRPDLTTFPRAAWLRAERAVLAELSADQLGYGDPRGAPRLRRAVAGWLARVRGVRVEPDAVLIVAGTAQALTLLHPVLRADGVDAVAVEDPGSLGARQHLGHGGLATPPVPVDAEGVRVDALRATGARAVLLTPAHQFPTGVVTSGERRRELLEWARGGGLILEDDYDAEHRYDRPPVPALRALLADRVCYMGSVSKLLAPALRIGWLVAPARHRAALVDAKRFNDLGNAVLPQLVLARLMESGELERHLRLVRGRHRRRRDAMIAALAEHLPGARVHGAAAGLHLTVTYAGDVPDTELAAAALARGVKCQPLSWHRQRPGPPGLVLGYAATPPGVVADGVAVLGRTLRELGRPAAVRLSPPLPDASPGPRSRTRRSPS
ncbi:PLP-dependent aminotransferase family protein [Streptomyces cyanogenus]|uniref:HTH-type transcriptional regulatory protein GabR n=1 Tax=Streptomyces cyanogenus TaxID=80860 RepID=A0ABX7TZ18_STRCY|nr:aminotransferase class I/II-fold pyridoxal phosphate-dependent enzyme [Streptomyces cyanogenus]QTE02035.1 HTH-type transcriptional regulatory protein GabR [Streptomyces cyanogenus]